MNQVDIKEKYIPFKGWVTEYTFSFAFKNLDYLVCDKYGNFFVLPHCKAKRTANFKKLNSKNNYIYYQRIKYYKSRLRSIIYSKKQKYIVWQ